MAVFRIDFFVISKLQNNRKFFELNFLFRQKQFASFMPCIQDTDYL
jgi:hypothetical protein